MGTNILGIGEKIKVMVATEEPLLALGATCLLASAGDFVVAKSPATYSEVIPLAAQEAPDLLLLDVTPEITPALFAVARQAAPNCRIVLWARALTEEVTHHAMQCGVRGFIRRTSTNEQFLEQLRRVVR